MHIIFEYNSVTEPIKRLVDRIGSYENKMSRQPAKLVQSISGHAPRNGVTPNATNARPHGSKPIAELSSGIGSRRFEAGFILGGHARHEAAIAIGLEQVACVRLIYTPDRKQASHTDLIRDCSKRGATVLDPFASSGASIRAAERTGRRAAAIELDPINVDAAIGRWQSIAGKIAVLAKDGRAFSEVRGNRNRAVELVNRMHDGVG